MVGESLFNDGLWGVIFTVADGAAISAPAAVLICQVSEFSSSDGTWVARTSRFVPDYIGPTGQCVRSDDYRSRSDLAGAGRRHLTRCAKHAL